MAAARLVELRLSSTNIEASGSASEGEWSRRTYPLIVALHTTVIAGTLLFGRSPVRRPWLVLLLALQPVRAWVLFLLGRRWNTRAAVATDLVPETRGPYAFVRHPNYTVVFGELFSLPAAFGLPMLGAAAVVANGVLLGPRIAEEESALMRLPGYADHFADKPRFIPGLF